MVMSFTTLTGTKATAGSIINWTGLTRIDPATVLDLAQAAIFTGMNPYGIRMTALRVRQMRTMATLSMADGDSTEALPTRYLDPIEMRDISNNTRLEQVFEGDMLRLRSYTSGVLDDGLPRYYAVFDELIQFDRTYEEATTLHFLHYAEPARLAADTNETNWLTSRYPHMLLEACKGYAHDFMQHEEAARACFVKLGALAAAANAESDLGRRDTHYFVETP